MPTAAQNAFALVTAHKSPASGVLTNTPGLYEQDCVAMGVVCETIFFESGGTTNHANRRIWALSMLISRGLLKAGMHVLSATVQDSTVQSSPTDAHVQTVVNSTITTMIPT